MDRRKYQIIVWRWPCPCFHDTYENSPRQESSSWAGNADYNVRLVIVALLIMLRSFSPSTLWLSGSSVLSYQQEVSGRLASQITNRSRIGSTEFCCLYQTLGNTWFPRVFSCFSAKVRPPAFSQKRVSITGGGKRTIFYNACGEQLTESALRQGVVSVFDYGVILRVAILAE